MNDCLVESDTNVDDSNSECYDDIELNSSHNEQSQQYTQYFKHKINLLNLLQKYKDRIMKTLVFYCNVCDFVTEEKYSWDKHTEREHPCATNRPTVHCSTCSIMIVDGDYEEHIRTIEHCILLKFVQPLTPIENDVIKSTKLVDTSTLDDTFIDPGRNTPFNLNKIDNTEAGTKINKFCII